jgi:hypothetical protein
MGFFIAPIEALPEVSVIDVFFTHERGEPCVHSRYPTSKADLRKGLTWGYTRSRWLAVITSPQ